MLLIKEHQVRQDAEMVATVEPSKCGLVWWLTQVSSPVSSDDIASGLMTQWDSEPCSLHKSPFDDVILSSRE